MFSVLAVFDVLFLVWFGTRVFGVPRISEVFPCSVILCGGCNVDLIDRLWGCWLRLVDFRSVLVFGTPHFTHILYYPVIWVCSFEMVWGCP